MASLGAVTRTVLADAAPSATSKPIAPEDIIKFELSVATKVVLPMLALRLDPLTVRLIGNILSNAKVIFFRRHHLADIIILPNQLEHTVPRHARTIITTKTLGPHHNASTGSKVNH